MFRSIILTPLDEMYIPPVKQSHHMRRPPTFAEWEGHGDYRRICFEHVAVAFWTGAWAFSFPFVRRDGAGDSFPSPAFPDFFCKVVGSTAVAMHQDGVGWEQPEFLLNSLSVRPKPAASDQGIYRLVPVHIAL